MVGGTFWIFSYENDLSFDISFTIFAPILLSCFVAFVYSFIVLFLFRHAIKNILWIISVGFIIFIAIVAGIFVFLYAKFSDIRMLLFACLLLMLIPVLCFVLYYYRKRYKLLAQIFKEASKALIDIPAIMFEPILTFLFLLFATFLFCSFILLISTASELFENPAYFHIIYFINFVVFIWFYKFIFSCQHFIIAGKQ